VLSILNLLGGGIWRIALYGKFFHQFCAACFFGKCEADIIIEAIGAVKI